MQETNRRPVRIANFSGYYGDRYSAFDEVMAGDPVDVLMGDYLAEITLASMSPLYTKDSSKGYITYFLRQIRPHLAALAERGLKVVTNAGAFNPEALANALREAIAEAGVTLQVAHVEGDNLQPRLAELRASGQLLENLDTGEPLSSWGAEPISAHAYLGGWGIATALREGADIVVCGRVTDASLTAGPAAWWHEWGTEDWDRLAGAVVAGHIIECGPHAVGGNFSGFTGIPGAHRPGFPIAEVAADGSSVITKHGRDLGAVTVDTVTAQLVYEIQGPRYLNPDVTVHLDTVRLSQAGPDRVRVTGTTGSPPPPTTKVALFAPIGHQIVLTVYLTGLDIEEKYELLRSQIRDQVAGPGVDELDVSIIGTVAADPQSQWEATVPVRIMATAREREPLEYANFAGRIGGLFLCSVPGFYYDTGAQRVTGPQPRIEYWPGLLPMAAVEHEVVLADGRRIAVAPPAVTQLPEGRPVHAEPDPYAWTGATERAPLGRVAHARSGDKGGNSNVGIWAADPAAWPWLRCALSTDELRRMVPEAKDLDIVRHEFPQLHAVHFVLRGLLGTGGSSNLRADQVGKAVGEYIRTRVMDIPVELLARREA
ncbi:acyclic terpene utilization AtuA family protein [Streptomyces sp. NPDC050315]|uniref:acyclic terpene utilization AtuA family protein n=1 Tax=Streptomyces sp. NPDC050315 TaxID=3155039 RepID=UPI00341882A4